MGEKEDVTALLRAAQAAVCSLTHRSGGALCQGRKEAPQGVGARRKVTNGEEALQTWLKLLTRNVRWGWWGVGGVLEAPAVSFSGPSVPTRMWFLDRAWVGRP